MSETKNSNSSQNALGEVEAFSTHIAVLGLLAAAYAQVDSLAPIPGWGKQLYGHGINVDGTLYTVGNTYKQVDGKYQRFMMLSVRKEYRAGGERPAQTYLIPVESLRDVLVELTIYQPSSEEQPHADAASSTSRPKRSLPTTTEASDPDIPEIEQFDRSRIPV